MQKSALAALPITSIVGIIRSIMWSSEVQNIPFGEIRINGGVINWRSIASENKIVKLLLTLRYIAISLCKLFEKRIEKNLSKTPKTLKSFSKNQ